MVDHVTRAAPGLTRRQMAAFGLAFSASVSGAARAQATRRPVSICIAEPPQFLVHTRDVIRRRFSLYRDIGVQMVRVGISFRAEQPNGGWSVAFEPWLDLAMAAGMNFKVEFEVLSGPPRWFLDANPGARLIDQKGELSTNDISIFWPNARTVVAEKTAKLARYWLQKGYAERTSFVIADNGPAAEPLYPATWTLGPGHQPSAGNFWVYGPGAVESFRAIQMRKYGSMGALNASWGTHLSSPDQIVIPEPGRTQGRTWADFLQWYRGAKRGFIEWQYDNTRSAYGGPGKILLLVPGTHIEESQFADASVRGGDDYDLTIMEDTQFILEFGNRKGCALQYTGMPSRGEITYIRNYLSKLRSDAPLWCENIGSAAAMAALPEIFSEMAAARCVGLDVVNASYLFDPSGQTPTPAVNQLSRLMKMG